MFCSLESQESELDASWIKLPDKIEFYLIFEFPHPWDRKIELSSHFPIDLRDYLNQIKDEGKKFKYLCVLPENQLQENNDSIDKTRVLFYKRNPDDYVKFERTELLVPNQLLVDKIIALIEKKTTEYEKYKIEFNHTREIFVCIHGVRDQCCGTFGTQIAMKLRDLTINNGNVRIWSSSHMGGHRVGPTILEFPSGTFWGYVSEDKVDGIFNQNLDSEMINSFYRGRMGLDRYSQILDKELFAQNGWWWFHAEKKSEILDQIKGKVKVKIEYISETKSGSYTGVVSEVGKIDLPKTQCAKATSLTKFEVSNITQESD